ncbi:MAG: hypothetical protein FJX72_18805 [Armatimonadetes bacterium]|nr:hypothetical protein [Armatimonadota bacterium]
MGELTSRTLAFIVGVAMIIVGVVGMSETVHPTKTALAASTLTVRLFGPVLIGLGALVLVASKRIPPKRRPSAGTLTITGLVTALIPAAIWGAGVGLARQDSAFWAPVVAAGLLLLTVPGLGMALGGARRLGGKQADVGHTAQPAAKVRRRK